MAMDYNLMANKINSVMLEIEFLKWETKHITQTESKEIKGLFYEWFVSKNWYTKETNIFCKTKIDIFMNPFIRDEKNNGVLKFICQ